MIEEYATVVGHDEKGVWVEAIQQSACASCQSRQGCGQQALNKLGKPMRLWIATEQRPEIGQSVAVQMPTGGLALSALVLYGLPIIAALLSAMFGHQWLAQSDTVTAACATVGLIIGLGLARYYSFKYSHLWHPKIISNGEYSTTVQSIH